MALTEMTISRSDWARESISRTMLTPKSTCPARIQPLKSVNMHSTQVNRLNTPNPCMLRMRYSRVRRASIWRRCESPPSAM